MTASKVTNFEEMTVVTIDLFLEHRYEICSSADYPKFCTTVRRETTLVLFYYMDASNRYVVFRCTECGLWLSIDKADDCYWSTVNAMAIEWVHTRGGVKGTPICRGK